MISFAIPRDSDPEEENAKGRAYLEGGEVLAAAGPRHGGRGGGHQWPRNLAVLATVGGAGSSHYDDSHLRATSSLQGVPVKGVEQVLSGQKKFCHLN